jgi:hypothetical protein
MLSQLLVFYPGQNGFGVFILFFRFYPRPRPAFVFIRVNPVHP